MAELIGRNEVNDPFPRTKSDQWTTYTAAQAAVGGRDSKSNPYTGLQVLGGLAATTKPRYAPHAALPVLVPGGTVTVELDARVVSFAAGNVLLVAVVPARDVDVKPPGTPGAVAVEGIVSAVGTFTATVTVPAGVTAGWLRLHSVSASGNYDVTAVRASYTAPDALGIFSGDTPSTEETIYAWEGEPLASPSTASTADITPDPDPEPEPDPAGPLAARVARNLGREGDAETIALAAEHVEIVMEYARGYTRGRGFNGDTPSRGIAAVIVAAASKLTSNPEQVSSYQTGDYSERGAVLNGWTLNQLSVLNTYRKRQS